MRHRMSYYDEEHGPPVMGTAQPSSDAEDDTEYPAAVLWLPDPTQKSGWTDRWVKKQKASPERRCGFRR